MDPENRKLLFKELAARMKKAGGRPSLPPPPPPPRRQKSFPNSMTSMPKNQQRLSLPLASNCTTLTCELDHYHELEEDDDSTSGNLKIVNFKRFFADKLMC